MLYTIENTVRQNRPVAVMIGGKEISDALWAFTFGSFVIALVVRKLPNGRIALMPGSERVATALRFGRGRVTPK